MRSDDILDARPVGLSAKAKFRLTVTAVLIVGVAVFLLLTWRTFFKYVPAGKHRVVVAKTGSAVPAGHILADEGEQGPQKKVLGEGWHFVMPIINTVEDAEDNTVIPPGKVGVVTARGGNPLPAGRVLANADEEGIQRDVLLPGVYRLNLKGYTVRTADAVEIKAGFVGVQRRRLGADGTGRFAENDNEKGLLHGLLQPGVYYLNPEEYEVIQAEVGIEQTTFHAPDRDHPNDSAIEFTSRGGFKIKMDCTIEWEVLPQDMADLVAEFGTRTKGNGVFADQDKVENIAIIQQAQAIVRDKGVEYGVQDLLVGSNREKFQADFTEELKRHCKEKKVVVRSAFIRNIEIPETYMKQIRDKQIAAETNLTNKFREDTNKSNADVAKEESAIEQKVKDVEYETQKMTTALDTEAKNIASLNEAEIEKLNQEFQAKIAALDAQKTLELGKAKTDVTKLKETAKSTLYKLKMDVFKNDGDAFLRYSLADQLNPELKVRLFHSGPGTFWTNMGDKNMNLLLPTPGSGDKILTPTKPIVGPPSPERLTGKNP
jgi:hypothetical protein